MAGKIRRFKGGYTSLWQKLSKYLPTEVHCNSEVLAIRRDSTTVGVDVKHSNGECVVMEFDKIIISGAFPLKNGKFYRSPTSKPTGLLISKNNSCTRKFILLSNCKFLKTESETQVMDMDELEKELFSKVQTIDYYTTVLKITGLEHLPVGFYYFGKYMEDPATIGHPVAMQKFFADTDIFLFWSYGNSVDIMGPTVTEVAIKTVENMGE